MGNVSPQGAADGGDEVVDVLEFFEAEHVGDLHGSEFADLADVVPEEVGDHDELGGFFFRLAEVEGGAGVELGIGEARAGAFDGAGFDLFSREAQEGLGRGGEDLASGEVQVRGEGSRGCSAKILVEVEESIWRGARGVDFPREVDLVDISGGDVFFGTSDGGDVGVFFQRWLPLTPAGF